MIKNNDSTVTLTKDECDKIKEAYNSLYDLINSFPSSMQDFFERSEYLNIEEAGCLLNDAPFVSSDYVSEEYDDDE